MLTRIVTISDIHEQWQAITPQLKKIKPNILCVNGDITYTGHVQKLREFNDWCAKIQDDGVVEEIIAIPGNHDISLERGRAVHDEAMTTVKDYILLHDSGVTVRGLNFYGFGWSLKFGLNWAFQITSEKHSREIYDKIPLNTDILMGHGPPHKIGDYVAIGGRHTGDPVLNEYLKKIRPSYFLCGHIHQSAGKYQTDFGTIVINAAICNEAYQPVQPIHVFEIEK